jgi:diguanylate cyclase (GGDEF)-like protein
MVCAMASANSWAAYDRQVLLIRTQETLASTDPLTGIPNRRAYLERVAEAVEAAAWGHQTVVCLVDLDGFKAVNDAHGHGIGDELLCQATERLSEIVRRDDVVARLGGDEFAVILADVTAAGEVETAAERARAAFAEPFTVGGVPVCVSASVGHAIWPDGGESAEALIREADAAMYREKAAPRPASYM